MTKTSLNGRNVIAHVVPIGGGEAVDRTGVVVSDLILRQQIAKPGIMEPEYPPVCVLVLWNDTATVSLVDVSLCTFGKNKDMVSIFKSPNGDQGSDVAIPHDRFVKLANDALLEALKEAAEVCKPQELVEYIQHVVNLTTTIIIPKVEEGQLPAILAQGIYMAMPTSSINLTPDTLFDLKVKLNQMITKAKGQDLPTDKQPVTEEPDPLREVKNKFTKRIQAALEQYHDLGISAESLRDRLSICLCQGHRLAVAVVTESNLNTDHELKCLHRAKRLDLAIESIMLEEEFKELFEHQELHQAAIRLSIVSRQD